tara:strand:- start:1589 stop:1804 length:216 start_codon:yes stop_codon:yes gene_type:complete
MAKYRLTMRMSADTDEDFDAEFDPEKLPSAELLVALRDAVWSTFIDEATLNVMAQYGLTFDNVEVSGVEHL